MILPSLQPTLLFFLVISFLIFQDKCFSTSKEEIKSNSSLPLNLDPFRVDSKSNSFENRCACPLYEKEDFDLFVFQSESAGNSSFKKSGSQFLFSEYLDFIPYHWETLLRDISFLLIIIGIGYVTYNPQIKKAAENRPHKNPVQRVNKKYSNFVDGNKWRGQRTKDLSQGIHLTEKRIFQLEEQIGKYQNGSRLSLWTLEDSKHQLLKDELFVQRKLLRTQNEERRLLFQRKFHEGHHTIPYNPNQNILIVDKDSYPPRLKNHPFVRSPAYYRAC